MKFLEDLSPFLEDGYCYARILSKLKVVQRHCAAHNNNVMLFDIETKTDKTEAEVKAEKKKTEILTDIVKQQERRQNEREQNDLQQYTRRWNLRVYKVPEDKAVCRRLSIEGMQYIQRQSRRPSQRC